MISLLLLQKCDLVKGNIHVWRNENNKEKYVIKAVKWDLNPEPSA
jgi:hypothetical protein